MQALLLHTISKAAGAAVMALALAMVLIGARPAAAEFAIGQAAFDKGDFTKAVKEWRHDAWRADDIHSQMRLGELYRDGNYVQKDPVEAYVWFYLASINVTRVGLLSQASSEFERLRRLSLIEREALLRPMVPEQRTEAFRRIVYVLASRGASGFYRLGEIYDSRSREDGTVAAGGGDGEGGGAVNALRELRRYFYTAPDGGAPGAAAPPSDASAYAGTKKGEGALGASGIPTNDAEALAYYMMSAQASHPVGALAEQSLRAHLMQKLPEADAKSIIESATVRAATWKMPFQRYPNPHSDESGRGGAAASATPATQRDYGIDLWLIQSALKALGHYEMPVDNMWGPGTRGAIKKFERSIGAQESGVLSNGNLVRLFQLAAQGGDPVLQSALGTIYFKGIGTGIDYGAAHDWYQRAASANEKTALYNLGVMYRDGLGVPKNLELSRRYFDQAQASGQ